MRRNFLIFFLLLCVLAVIVGVHSRGQDPQLPRAVQGVLDARGRDFDQQAAVKLDGEWNLYWQRFVDPALFENELPPRPDGTLNVPGSWDGHQFNGQTVDGKGYATLHLKVLVQASDAPLGLRLRGFFPANRIWVNGQLLAETGRVAERAEEAAMNHSIQIVRLPDEQQLDIVLHVSNFQMRQAGTSSIHLGKLEDLRLEQQRDWVLAAFSIGTLLLMAFYHLALYLMRRKNPSPLYFALNCLFWSVFFMSNESSGWLIRMFIPQAGGDSLFRVWPVCLFMASAFSFQFYRSIYPAEFPRWLAQALWAISGAYVLVAIIAPIPLLVLLLPGYFLVTLGRMVYTAWALFQAARRQRVGALIILDGYLLMIVLSVNDMLYGAGFIRSVLVLHLGMIIYMFTQALALAQRFSALFASVESLSSELVENNEALNEEIAERTRLQQEVITVSEEERRRISHVLHDGLCQQLTGARLRCSGLAAVCGDKEPGGQDLKDLEQLLDETVDQAHELSRGLWPMELESEDIVEALGSLIQRQRLSSGLPIDFVRRGACADCTRSKAAQIYGIVREAIANAIKHAQASRIVVMLECDESRTITLSIADDGVGRSEARQSKEGLGIRIMTYRARMVGGTISIKDREGGGTLVLCSFPGDRSVDSK